MKLNFRDIVFLDLPPGGRVIRLGGKMYFIYPEGEVWAVSANRYLSHDVDSQGYHSVTLGDRCVKLHRLILMVFMGKPPKKHVGRHLDGDPSNNHIANLAWGTPQENWEDRKRHGRVNSWWEKRDEHENKSGSVSRHSVRPPRRRS